MHIVYVCREYPPAKRMGGIAAYLKEISVAMVSRGHQVTVVCANDNTHEEIDEEVDGVRVIRLAGGDFIVNGSGEKNSPLKKLRTIYRFKSYRNSIRKKILSLGKVDVIEVPEYGAESYCLNDVDIPITIRLHTPTLLDRESGNLKRFKPSEFHEYWVGKKELKILSSAKHITSCSKSLLDWCNNNIKINPNEAEVIYNPLNTARWKSENAISYNEKQILFVGTVAESKGISDLIKAISKLNSAGRGFKLKIAGKLGSFGENLKNECIANNYDWCDFLGHVNREELMQLYRQSKVACFPSWWENLPMVCIESMAIGNITIGSEAGGMSEIITDGVDGFLVKPGDIDAMADLIDKAMNMSDMEIAQMRKNAYKTIINKFSTDIIATQLQNYYESIAK